MYPNPYGYDESPKKFKRRKARANWRVMVIAIGLIIALVVPMAFAPTSIMRDLYIMGFMICVVIFALYRVTFSTLFGERAAKREFSLPASSPVVDTPPSKPRKRERLRTADGKWLEVVDEDQIS